MNIELGKVAGPHSGGAEAMLDVEELLATRLLVQGNSGSGKSHLLRRLIEQSAPYVQQVIIDPEGDFVSLAERFGHVVLDAERGLGELEVIATRVRQHRVSAVLNLESLDVQMQMRAAGTFLNAMFDADREHWFPVLVVVDEAQLFAPAVAGEVSEEARKLSLGAMTNLMCRGRKRGLAGIIATQRLAKLAKNVAAEASNFLMGRTFLDIDMVRAADLLGLERRQAETFRDLGRGQFVALGPALTRRPITVSVGTVETAPRAGTPKLTPLPAEAAAAQRELVLAPVPVDLVRPVEPRVTAPSAPTMHDLLASLAREAPAEAAEAPDDGLTPQEREAQFLVIARAVMAEPGAPFRGEAPLYQDFLVRCRIQRLPATLPLAQFRFLLNLARTGIDPALAETEDWQRVVELARALPDEAQLSFLLIAAAALTGGPCPSDAELALRSGTHSAGRARSRLRHLEKSGHIVLRVDIRGHRAAVLPDLGIETAAGDARAPYGDGSVAAE
ncbi:MAG TPA: ATP-binding protein [Kaistia sp.]|nr:ATP-binding protein [Kaistia sp.]